MLTVRDPSSGVPRDYTPSADSLADLFTRHSTEAGFGKLTKMIGNMTVEEAIQEEESDVPE